MSKAGQSIRKGLEQAIACARGAAPRSAYRVHVPRRVNVKAIRRKLKMSQQAFAGHFGLSINTLRHWEQGKRIPHGAARTYLLVIERAPDAVRKALRIA